MQAALSIESTNIRMIAATKDHLRVELNDPQRLGDMLGAIVTAEWPSGEYDRDAMSFFLARLEEGGEAAEGWYSWYALALAGDVPALLGAGGYFGPRDEEGAVEIGYSVVPSWQGKGYASEIVKLLVERAFTFSDIRQVIAHVSEQNAPSIAVLRRCDFSAAGVRAHDDMLRFELRR